MSVIYNKVRIPVSGGEVASTWIANHLSSLSDRFTVSTNWGNNATWILDNKVRMFTSVNYTNLWWIEASRDYSSEGAWYKAEWGRTGDLILETIIAPEFVYLRYIPASDTSARGGVVVCIPHGDHYYVGGAVLGSSNDISTIQIRNIDNGVGDIYFKNLLPFPIESGSIAYLPNAFISNNGSICIPVEDTLGCTTIPYDSNVSIDTDNYYAIGTNTLIRIDEVIE